MPAKLFHKFTKPEDVKQSDWNRWIREGYTAAGLLWVQHYALKHFEPGAVQRYQYSPRKDKYRRKRAAIARARGEQPADWVFSGVARGIARMRAANPFMARVNARATSNKQFVQVPIPIGHAIRPGRTDLSSELGRLTNDEMIAMTRVVREHLAERLRQHSVRKITVTIGAAA